MTRFALTGLLILAATRPHDAHAQQRSVKGVVVDSAGTSVPNAFVELNDSRTLVVTDRNGRFRLPITKQADCLISVTRGRYQVKHIDLSSCADTTVRIVLMRSSVESDRGSRCGTRSTTLCEGPQGMKLDMVSAGQSHTCGIAANRTAWCWGDGRKGALGTDSTVNRWPVQVASSLRFLDIAAGGNYTCGLATDGTVYCWGTSEVVPGWPKRVSQPVTVGQFSTGARLTAGRRHACVLDAQKAHCWGWNVDGETGTGSSGIASSLLPAPMPVTGDYRFTSLSAGMGFTCGTTTNGQLLCWGSNVDRVLGSNATVLCGDVDPVSCSPRPLVLSTPEPVRLVSAGTTHACALSDAGNVLCWGSNGFGQVGDAKALVATPLRVQFESAEKIATIASGGIETCAVTTTSTLYCWGADPRRRNETISTEDVRPRLVARDIRSVTMGQGHGCAVTKAGRALCWGDTILGAFGTR